MKRKRKSPYYHRVKSHTRKGKLVHSYYRGRGLVPRLKHHYTVLAHGKLGIDNQTKRRKYMPKVRWNPYKEYAQQRVWITPEEFLRLCTPPMYGTKKQPFDFSKHSIKGLEKVFDKGEELYALRLDVRPDGKVVGHEGRHRAYVAYKRDWKKIPVTIWHEDSTGHLTEVKKPFEISKLKREKVEDYLINRFSAWDILKRRLK